jgi:hypothetical protein
MQLSMILESYPRAIPQGAPRAPDTVVHTAVHLLVPEAEKGEDEERDRFLNGQ